MKTSTYPEAGQAPDLIRCDVEAGLCANCCARMDAAVTVRQLRRACSGTVWVIWHPQSIAELNAARDEAKARIGRLRTVKTRAARRQLSRKAVA